MEGRTGEVEHSSYIHIKLMALFADKRVIFIWEVAVMRTVFLKRPSELRIREQLPNGQKRNLYFVRHRAPGNFYQWQVGLYIGDRKEANLWFNHHSKKYCNGIKGDGSITALRCALRYIIEFANNMSEMEELTVSWHDDKRKRAYQYLRRYGFFDYYDASGNLIALGTRNQEYWEWVD